MDPLFILAISMVVVIGAVLALRLHAFLALMLGALTVSLLTSNEALFQREIQPHEFTIADVTEGRATFEDVESNAVDRVAPGRYVIRRSDSSRKSDEGLGAWQRIGTVELNRLDDQGFAITVLSSASEDDAVTPQTGDRVVAIDAYDAAVALQTSNQTQRIANGFASTCGKIGIIIALAAVIGQCLLDSGAAERIVDAMRRRFGEERTPAALTLSGFVIGIPVYFDTVFYLLLPLARALGRRNGNNYLLYVLSIIVGATMAHSLVPPTPGPLLVASELDVPLGMMIIAGGAVGLVTVACGFLYAVWANRRWTIEVPDDVAGGNVQSRLEHAPPLVWSLLPIALPVVLLAVGTLLKANGITATSAVGTFSSLLVFVTDKHVALAIATVAALWMLIRFAGSDVDWVKSVSTSISSAGSIVLITAAGGAFGHVLRQSGIATAIQSRFPSTESGTLILLIAFSVTAIVRVAQGSATVAMITSVGIVAPLVTAVELPFHPVYVALAIGCGSKPLPWMNDSGFWVITRMSGMTEAQSLKTFSVVLTIMGLVGLLVTLAGATWLPLRP